MKKNLLLTAALAGVLALATACSSQGTTTATTAAQTTAAETTAAKETAEVKETANVKETADAKETADKKETADAKETTEKADEEKESTMTGTISDIKDFMFTITSDGNDYAFTFDNDKKPEGLAEVKDGDKVTVTYTGTVSAVDAFSGTVVSVKAAK
ncbi:hypothetical protein DW020_09775 [Clostridium sp. AF37-5AT]|nr:MULTISPECIES: hypothetical protein [unclassified Clostridium]RHO04258.1 hypothetical protein DW260_04315 [Clostridium sp. AM22-16AC]RHO94909.1 hypothetical protein DW020_09775 [Clostridium sp. AF37-5AT]